MRCTSLRDDISTTTIGNVVQASFTLHVGYQKTGSTWLQEQVLEVSDGLFVVDRRATINHLIDPGRLAFDPTAARNALLAGRSGDDAVVVSHEWLVGHPFGNGYDTEVLSSRMFLTFGEDCQVLLVIRRQEEMLRSHYGEWISHGGSLSPRRFMGAPTTWRWHPAFRFDYFEYDRVICHYREVFGDDRVTVRLYEDLAENMDGFVQGLRFDLGLDMLTIGDRASAHRSLSQNGLALLRQSNRVLSTWGHNPAAPVISPGAHGRLARELRKVDAVAPEWLRSWPALEQRRAEVFRSAAADRYAESNRRTQELTGLDLAGSGYQL